jgi:hypothetical protein
MVAVFAAPLPATDAGAAVAGSQHPPPPAKRARGPSGAPLPAAQAAPAAGTEGQGQAPGQPGAGPGSERLRLLPAAWWAEELGAGRGLGWWFSAVDGAALAAEPTRRRLGFLNALEDMLGEWLCVGGGIAAGGIVP